MTGGSESVVMPGRVVWCGRNWGITKPGSNSGRKVDVRGNHLARVYFFFNLLFPRLKGAKCAHRKMDNGQKRIGNALLSAKQKERNREREASNPESNFLVLTFNLVLSIPERIDLDLGKLGKHIPPPVLSIRLSVRIPGNPRSVLPEPQSELRGPDNRECIMHLIANQRSHRRCTRVCSRARAVYVCTHTCVRSTVNVRLRPNINRPSVVHNVQ